MLSHLRNNGGPTFTQALLAASPAIDGGDDSVVEAPMFLDADHTSAPRRPGRHVDIATYEWQSEAPQSAIHRRRVANYP